MDDLTPNQRAAVQQLRELTNGGDDAVAVDVLSSVDWDVQRAVELVFGGGQQQQQQQPPPPQQFEIDDSEQRGPPQAQQPLAVITRPLLAIISLPFTLLGSIFRFIFGVLRIPLPRFLYLPRLGLNTGARPPRNSRGGGADRWIRDLEDETGAVSITRLLAARGASTSLPASGSSNLTSRGPNTTSVTDKDVDALSRDENGNERRLLPDFHPTSYEAHLKSLIRDFKVGCVILVSEEHDDVPEFKRSTLTDLPFIRALTSNGVLVWGGDIRERDAWNAAEKLQATTFPFVAFIALQPKRTVGASSTRTLGSGSTPTGSTLTILSRHQGPSTSDGPTSAKVLTQHLLEQVLPRTTPHLIRLRAAAAELARERALREEQDRAFAEAAARDRDRIHAKMTAEQRAREEAAAARALRLQLETTRREEERILAEEKRKNEERLEAERQQREVWRRWIRRALGIRSAARLSTSTETPAPKPLRIALRLPSGARTIHHFTSTDTLTTLYATVAAALAPSPDTAAGPSHSLADDPAQPPSAHRLSTTQLGEDGRIERVIEDTLSALPLPAPNSTQQDQQQQPTATQKWWQFTLTTAYPRQALLWAPGVPLGEIPSLRGGGQLVVEELAESSSAARRSIDSTRRSGESVRSAEPDSDEYESEED